MELLKDRVAVVTGGANGIGAACTLEFAKNKAKCIYILDMDEAGGAKTVKLIEEYCPCTFIKTNVADEQTAADVVGKIIAQEGRIDILFNCAGITSTKGVFETDTALWDKVMNINARGTFFFCREAIKSMMENKYGKIINVSSISAHVGGIRTTPAYAASKAAVIALTMSFAKLGAKSGVTVNAIAPGIAITNMTSTPDFHYSVDEVPMGRAAYPEDIAKAVLFLASPMSDYITGQCLNVDGGMYFG